MKIVTVIGARPQFIKAATVSRELRNYDDIEEIILHTGQHYDKNISDIFFEELNIPAPKYNLNVGSGAHGVQTAKMLSKIEDVLLEEKPDCVLVYGDTNSTTAGAMAAVKLHIPVAHVEAGLRSFNRQMPEEINRIVTDAISDLLLAPTNNAVEQLKTEGRKDYTYFVGDVMYDSVLYYKGLIEKRGKPDLIKGIDSFYLCTIHRAENTDNEENLKSILSALSQADKTIVLPLHPRTKHIIKKLGIKTADNIHIEEPVGYFDMLSLLAYSDKMITDSGGVQKEAYFLQKPCVTLRNETEWIETLDNGWNQLCGANLELILDALDYEPGMQTNLGEFGDGNAARKTIDLIKEKYFKK
ncbi:MAG: UDP-N-acetylglucosamine 2-epimerase (non-hydrolyzing) [Candidatus Cloacimonadales bacterium]|jgi:UDP-N-acetylglucosamine 2-epimerase|nr:UDP-N-acetylglucosamine 2-epimerase (non-hydrolyzing) [Candidatus Cloacimonadota bacterium]MDD2650008.1 UDP-N-acetylglucosamine 2-epimerase (non-hydrolyzing) [Candidatus Cloacimonadota bacterium]MDD3501159.1 UDP-N-acetylglucosamine 2-epimerase (non-hydrolyzing) [Candidatus Cloacimonadota bacterium]MDX9976531.1 UDP-N-acetylglucosamine 2-epimerase (non-hydrolyzing) [Candidatus Cloacimonadales bacterium]